MIGSRAVAPLLRRMTVGRLRVAVLVVAALAAALKIYVASKTLGTDDVYLFGIFSRQVREHGPIGIYGAPSETLAPYNHPPLSGWMLALFNVLVDNGARFATLVRLPATLSDVVTAVLLFELIRTRRPVWEAAAGAMLLAWSPALGIISGYHGNTDPVSIMFALLALYLLVVRNAPALAGLSFAVGLSIKLVPVVMAPILLYIAWRGGRDAVASGAGRRHALAFIATFGAVLAVIWGPALLTHFTAVRTNVIGYAGYGPRQWGPAQFAAWLGVPQHWVELYAGPGRFLVLLLSAGLPVLLAWRRPSMTLPAAGLPMALFLLLTPAHAMQYTIWPVACLYLVNIWPATVYSLAAGALLAKVYSRWSHAYPWHWYQAWSTGMDREERRYAAMVWLVLLVMTAVAVLPRFSRARPDSTATDWPARPPLTLRPAPAVTDGGDGVTGGGDVTDGTVDRAHRAPSDQGHPGAREAMAVDVPAAGEKPGQTVATDGATHDLSLNHRR